MTDTHPSPLSLQVLSEAALLTKAFFRAPLTSLLRTHTRLSGWKPWPLPRLPMSFPSWKHLAQSTWAEKGGTPPPPALRDKDTQAFCSSDPHVRKCSSLVPIPPKKNQEAKLTFLPHPGYHVENWVWLECNSGLDRDNWLARPCGRGFHLCCCVNGDSRPWPLRVTAAASRTG